MLVNVTTSPNDGLAAAVDEMMRRAQAKAQAIRPARKCVVVEIGEGSRVVLAEPKWFDSRSAAEKQARAHALAFPTASFAVFEHVSTTSLPRSAPVTTPA